MLESLYQNTMTVDDYIERFLFHLKLSERSPTDVLVGKLFLNHMDFALRTKVMEQMELDLRLNPDLVASVMHKFDFFCSNC